ncbi:hypothetical protein DITRI_Ditri16bG0078900 [Diplodiscus trichospermus]
MEDLMVNFEVNIPEAEMGWLHGCIMGRLKDNLEVKWMEEVKIQVWHYNFFEGLGNRWGKLVRLDDDTMNKCRFDIARMLVFVDSIFRIPPIVTVHLKGTDFKILVTMDEYEDMEHEKSTDVEEGALYDEVMKTGKVDKKYHNRSKEVKDIKGRKEGEEIVQHEDFDLGVRINNCNTDVGGGSRMTEEEMIGGDVGLSKSQETKKGDQGIASIGEGRGRQDSDRSISDEDIMHRNSVVLKEAQLTWEIGNKLGIIFEGHKDMVISKFVEMEYEDRRGRRV